jgi:hypothetical protein
VELIGNWFLMLRRVKLKRGLDSAKAVGTTDEMRAFSKIITIPGTLKVIAANPDDDAVVECAVVAQAQRGCRPATARVQLRKKPGRAARKPMAK